MQVNVKYYLVPFWDISNDATMHIQTSQL